MVANLEPPVEDTIDGDDGGVVELLSLH